MLKKITCLLVCFAFLCTSMIFAKEDVGQGNTSTSGKITANCQPATAYTELNINNVRAGLMTGGDIWWDLSNGRYEVPKIEVGSGETSVSSLFAGALWIGGIDQLGQLKIAAQTYRQTGNDFWPGPLDENGEVEEETCGDFDRFFEVKGENIAALREIFSDETVSYVSPTDISQDVLLWPGKDNPHLIAQGFNLPENKNLAPFFDLNADGVYDPTEGDYPVIDTDCSGVYADQMIWWIFNDKGDNHTATGGEAIGLEIGALAFAFATNDEVNNMTFYKYEVNNTASTSLDSVYFGQWVDPDLGQYDNDYVGCNVDAGLGIVYNGESTDNLYDEIPMLGVDFFRGPKKFIGVNEDGEDEYEELGMSAFVYYNNDDSPQGNPRSASDFYGYLSGYWRNGTPLTYGGNGTEAGEPYPYMFPDDPSDTSPTVWSECAVNNPPADRRFLQVSGPFELLPTSVDDVIVGVVWVRDGVEYPCPSFQPLLKADAKAQALFDSCFKLVNGPDAPDMSIIELDKELIISLYNEGGNNANEDYAEADAVLSAQGEADSLYRFQGYRIFQLKDSEVSTSEYSDINKAREIATVDIIDGVTRLINYESDATVGAIVPILKVEGSDNGIKHTFQVTEDQFATGDKRLVNNRKYYFSVVAYAHNAHQPFDYANPQAGGQQTPYLEGRNRIDKYVGIPHKEEPQFGGVQVNAEYGDGPEIIQLSGLGSGGNVLELTPETEAEILANGFSETPVYVGGSDPNGPINVKVYDPLLIPSGTFDLKIHNSVFGNIGEADPNVSGLLGMSPNTPIELSNGTVTINDDYTLTYEPNEGFEGVEQFTYTVSDQYGDTDIANVVIEVGNVSGLTYAADDTYKAEFTGNPNYTVEIELTANDVAENAEVLSVDLDSPQASNADAIIISSDGTSIEYDPKADYSGYDKVTYYLDNNRVISGTLWVNISNEGPNALDDRASTGVGESVVINVLDNDENVFIGDAPDGLITPFSTWTLTDANGNTYVANEYNMTTENEIAIGGWAIDGDQTPLGFTVTLKQPLTPRLTNAFIDASLTFENGQDRWLGAMNDQNGESVFNWIRSGTDNPDDLLYDDYAGYDDEEYYESMLEGAIAPFCLAAKVRGDYLGVSPGCSSCELESELPNNTLDNLASVKVVLTQEKELWTQCVVVEQGKAQGLNEGGASPSTMRLHKSLKLDGSYSDTEYGRSWFPGYAINLETGERLNMMFGENSTSNQNGLDMIWNPTDVLFQGQFPNGLKFGGEHYVYIMGTRYDNGVATHNAFSLRLEKQQEAIDLAAQGDINGAEEAQAIADAIPSQIYDDALYVSTTVLEPGNEMLPMSEGLIPSAAEILIHMATPYRQSPVGEPLHYQFNFGDLAANKEVREIAENALDEVYAVPNPYYAYSEYENSQLDNRILITNLPDICNIRVFNLDGTLIKDIKVDNSDVIGGTSYGSKVGQEIINYAEWDLKNEKGVPIGGGVYLIHIEAPELGLDKTIKWFAVIRPTDLDTF